MAVPRTLLTPLFGARALLAWGAALLLAGAAIAQETTGVLPSAALRCLTPGPAERGTPDYPEEALRDRLSGLVTVELIFITPDKRPEVKVMNSGFDKDFVQAVTEHVSRFRVPCLEAADIPARLRQTYNFVPDSRQVTWLRTTDADDAERTRMLGCVVHTKPGAKPEYPFDARRIGEHGRVLMTARFSAPDQPPQVTVIEHKFNRLLARSVREFAAGLRMPCQSGQSVDMFQTYFFKFEGGKSPGFRDLSLRQFVSNIEGIDKQQVAFDFTTMNCPFEVKLNYFQPHLPNKVGVVGPPDASREAFLAWLSQARLKGSDAVQASILGAPLDLQVACGAIDLRPAPSKP